MKVRMLRTQNGSPDGIQVFVYEAGRKYDIPAELAAVFLAQGWAEEDKELALEVKDEIALSEEKTKNRKRRKQDREHKL